MFRKLKRKAKDSLRRNNDTTFKDTAIANDGSAQSIQGDDDVDEPDTNELLSEARKRSKQSTSSLTSGSLSMSTTAKSKADIMHTYTTAKGIVSTKDLVTSVAEHHPDQKVQDGKAAKGEDGIFRNQTRNKFHAGPIRAAQHVRVTARFDYQPDICKDYKETGFCGFGDTCIYLHDRGDTMTGWQLEQQWEEQQRIKKEKQEKEISQFLDGARNEEREATELPEDGLPFACHICRQHFHDPVVTTCGHFFCQSCIFDRVRNGSELCPICNKDTHGVFNQPTKLIAKKRQLLGINKSNAADSWEQYLKRFTSAEERK
jgi:RING finger protein 113A